MKIKKYIVPVAIGIYALICIAFFAAQQQSFPDDVYITLRFARNFAEGHGLVYNVGQRYLGTSGPGYAILLGLTGRIVGINSIPIAAEVIASLSIFLTSIGLLIAFKRKGYALLGFVSGLLYAILPYTRTAYGFEVLPQMACVIWAYHFYSKNQEENKPQALSLLLMAVAVYLRPDGILWFLPLAIHLWIKKYDSGREPSDSGFKERFLTLLRGLPAKEIGLYLCFLAFGELVIWLSSGMFLPVTFTAKTAQRMSTDWDSFLTGLGKWTLGLLQVSHGMALLICLGFLGLMMVGYTLLVKKNVLAGLLLGGSGLYFLIYSLKLPFYGWYAVPEGLMLALLTALSIDYLVKASMRISRYVAAGLLLLLCVFGYSFTVEEYQACRLARDTMASNEKLKTYYAFGQWLKENTDVDQSVGLCEVGIIGWVSNRPVVDQFFLVSPGDVDSISRHIYDKSFKEGKPTYIAESPLLFGTMRGHDWFWQNYEFWTSFPSHRSAALSLAQADQLRKQGKMEIDVWRRRPIPLTRAQALALATGSRKEMKAWEDARKREL